MTVRSIIDAGAFPRTRTPLFHATHPPDRPLMSPAERSRRGSPASPAGAGPTASRGPKFAASPTPTRTHAGDASPSEATADESSTGKTTSPASGERLATSAATAPSSDPLGGWSALGWNLLGALLLILAYEPVGLWPLAWVAFAPWLRWVEPTALPRRTYSKLYLAYVVACLGVLYWLTMAHWVAFVGWIALCLYLGVYLPIFVGLCRVAVHRLGCPLVVAAPLLWMGLEYCRCTAMTGFPMGLLCHATTDWLHVIQVADLAGAYLVSGLMIAVAAGLASSWPTAERGWRVAPLVAALALVLAAGGYGRWRVNQPKSEPELSVALVQGDHPETTEYREGEREELFKLYFHLTEAALVANRPDLVMWPETIYRFGLGIPAPPAATPPTGEATLSQERVDEFIAKSTSDLRNLVDHWGVPALIGLDLYELSPHVRKRYNAAALLAPGRGLLGTYAKNHLVPFGEFIPLGETYPWIYSYTPLGGGLSFGRPDQPPLELPRAGKRPARLVASICFETTVPHRTRAQVVSAIAAGSPPDVIANVTNDGWFHGSAELDVHLACGVFRAIENRVPLVIAANTGLSANVDADGRVLWRSERMKPTWHVARVSFDPRDSLYLAIGDWPVAICLFACVGLAIYGLATRGRPIAAG